MFTSTTIEKLYTRTMAVMDIAQIENVESARKLEGARMVEGAFYAGGPVCVAVVDSDGKVIASVLRETWQIHLAKLAEAERAASAEARKRESEYVDRLETEHYRRLTRMDPRL